MRAQVPVKPLRGRDPLTIEIEVPSLAGKPIGQLAPQNVADLCALELLPDLAHGLKVRLRGFSDRIARAIVDLPTGALFLEALEHVSALPDAQVPANLRSAWAAQSDLPKRSEAERAAVRTLLERWETTEPEDFVMGEVKKKAVVLPTRNSPPSRFAHLPAVSREVREASGVAPKPRAAPTPRAVVPVDAKRAAWIESTLVARVQGSEGLLEEVLITTVKHRARERYPDLQAHEIRSALKTLETRGLVRSSANRWRPR